MVLVGNKSDQDNADRMVTKTEGQKRAREISCACFHEISVRDSSGIEQVWGVFQDVSRFWRVLSKNPKLKRSTSDVHFDDLVVSPERVHPFITCDFQAEKRRSILLLGRSSWKLKDLLDQEEKDEFDEKSNSIVPFRNRALTDGTLLSKRKYRLPIIISSQTTIIPSNTTRRNSISMRGNVT